MTAGNSEDSLVPPLAVEQGGAPSAPIRDGRLARAVIRAIAEGVIGFDGEPPYRLRFANPHAERLLGVSEAEVLGRPLETLLSLHGEGGCGCRGIAEWRRCAGGLHFEATLVTLGRPEGFAAELAFSCLAEEGDDLAVLTFQDVTARRQTEEKLRLSDKVFEYSAEAIVITDEAGIILAVNPAFTWLTGYRPDEAIGQTPRILKSGRHDDGFYSQMWRTLADGGHWEGELWDKRKDGSHYPKWLTINAVRAEGRTTHYVALFSDISERKENENRIQFLAEHDHLTGLPNRRLLELRASQLMAAARRRHDGLALMLIDLDRFKNVNDTLGHQVGDRLLIEVARRLSASVRVTDTVVRLGGDEFVVLLEGAVKPADLTAVARKIWATLNEPIVVDGKVLHTPPSIGISVFPGDGDDIETLMRHADTAMYQVKAAGRNSWLFYKTEMNEAVQERLQLETDLRHGLAHRQFELHFQPQFDLASGAVVAWEALLRWPHPQRGWVPPQSFIGVAEETGLILPLGDWVLRSACEQVVRWQRQGIGRHRVSVNLSPVQLSQPRLVEGIAHILAETGVEPCQLELEITESMLLSRCEQAMATLGRLKELGVFLTLDDFGTGYSSLAYLRTYSVDRLKIDRSFIRDLGREGNDAAIVRAVICLANALNLGVVAEGVETAAQQDFLHAHGCRHTQGFFRGRPMPGHEVSAFLAGLDD